MKRSTSGKILTTHVGSLPRPDARPHWVATAPISYRGTADLQREIDVFRAVIGSDTEAFITTMAPASLEPYRRSEYYKSQEEFVFAIAEADRISGDHRRWLHSAGRRCLAACALGPDRHRNGATRVPQILRGAD